MTETSLHVEEREQSIRNPPAEIPVERPPAEEQIKDL